MQAPRAREFEQEIGPAVVDVAVEFAHVYADETFGPEHLAGVFEATQQTRRLKAAGRSYSLSVLIDDYNPEACTLDTDTFIASLQRHGGAPDYVVLESTLADAAESLLTTITGREGRGLRRYLKSRGRMPCALLVAAWHLLRLGSSDLPAPPIGTISPDRPFVGRESLTVLPVRFRAVEKRATEIIEASPYWCMGSRIRHIFF